MRSKLGWLSVLVLTSALLAPAAYARKNGNPTGKKGSKFATQHPRRNEVNKRVNNQRARINQGVKDGQLTKGQAQQLRQNENQMKKQEHADVRANGGHLTKAEQKQFNQEENAESRMIHDERHPAGQ